VDLLPVRLVHGQAGEVGLMPATFTLDVLKDLPERGQFAPGDRIEVRFIVTVEDVYQERGDIILVPGEPEHVRGRLLPRRPSARSGR
jgi:hypothetical protein